MTSDPATRDEQQRQYSRITAKAWADPAYKQALLADPKTALAEEGVQVAGTREVRVVENSEEVFYFVLQQRPDDLSDDQLARTDLGACVATECDICATE